MHYEKTVWLISPFDSIPGEVWGYKHSLYVAESLIKNEFKVIYWTCSYSHALKKQRSKNFEELVINNKFIIRIIPTSEYTDHVSIKRLKSMFDFAFGVLRYAWTDKKPCCIIAPITSLFQDIIVVILSKKFKVPLVTDLRDLWPEIFLNYMVGIKFIFKPILLPLFMVRRYILNNSAAFTSVCETYRHVALKDSKNIKKIPNEIIYSTGIDLQEFQKSIRDEGRNGELLNKPPYEFWAIYAGTIGSNYDIETLLNAAIILKSKAIKLKILIAGNGPKLNYVIEFIKTYNLDNVRYLGVLDSQLLAKYYAKCDIGLSLYGNMSTVAIPAKIFDFYASGLPIINSVRGELEKFICDNNIGFQYEAGNVNSLIENLLTAISDPQRLLIIKKNLLNISIKFDRKIQYAKLSKLVEQILDKKG